MPKKTPRDYGIVRNFESRLQDLRTLLGTLLRRVLSPRSFLSP